MKKLILCIILSFVFAVSYSQKDNIVIHDSLMVSKRMISKRLLCSVDLYKVKHVKDDVVISEINYITYKYPKYYFWRKKPKF